MKNNCINVCPKIGRLTGKRSVRIGIVIKIIQVGKQNDQKLMMWCYTNTSDLQHHTYVVPINIIFCQMRLLVVFILLSCCFGISPPTYHRFIVFTNDGTFYKLDPGTKQVQWHNQLPFKLLSFDITPQIQPQNNTKKFFIPTIDGDFVYLEHNLLNQYSKELLVPRQDVQKLLDICFETKPDQKYFVYQKMEYFVLNTKNGQFKHLQDFLNEKSVFNKSVHTIIIIAKKLLKQLNIDMEVKWSVISSKISLQSIDQFVMTPKMKQIQVFHPIYSFLRTDPKTIQILDQNHNIVFSIQASSSILSIFSEDQSTHNFKKIIIKNFQQKMLALEGSKTETFKSKVAHDITIVMKQSEQKFQNFPHSQHYSPIQKSNQNSDNLEICLKAHKILKQSKFASKTRVIESAIKQSRQNLFQHLEYQYLRDFDPQELPTLPYSTDKRIKVIVTKEQPFVYIFLIVIIVGTGLMFYRFKVNKLWQQISQMESMTNEQNKKIAEKLGQYQSVGKQLKKMYEINWQKILYKNGVYFIFQGRFLNQSAEVLVLPLNGFDIIDIEHKLNILINCSHKFISKLYYYTRNQDSLLIFTENNPALRRLTQLGDIQSHIYSKLANDTEMYKHCIKVLLDSLSQIMSLKLQVHSFCAESLLISQSIELKINMGPTFLNKVSEQEDKKLLQMGTSRLRLDIIKIIHKLGHKGDQFDLLVFEKQKNTEHQEKVFLKDFYDHLLLTNECSQDIEALKNAVKHPYLWDSTQKMLYVCDFSNYIQTCIDEPKIAKMETHCKNYQIITYPWIKQMHPTLAKQINTYRKYDFNSVRALIRLMRNKLSHFHEIPKETRAFIGKTPEQFVEHFLQKFPKLLSFMYVYANKKKWRLNAAPLA